MTSQFPLTQAANHLPRRRGKKIHYSTLHRWATKGARGRRLRTWYVGGTRFTSLSAIHEFLGPSNPITKASRETEIDVAEKLLESAGL